MPFVHGKNATIWVWDASGTCRNLSGDKNSITLAWDKNNPETTTFGKVATQRIAGLTDATLSGAGIWNSDDTTGLDDVLGGILAASTPTLVQFSPAGSLAGCPMYSACYQMSKYDVIGPIGGVVAANWEFQLASGSLTAELDYTQVVVNTLGNSLFGYWPLNEASGASAFDYSGNARTGAYTNVTLGQPGIGDGNTAAAFVESPASKMNPYSTALDAAIAAASGLDEGYISLWIKISSAALWADANSYYFTYLTTDFTNGLVMRKVGSNSLTAYRRVGAQVASLIIDCPTTARWLHLGFAWSVAQGKAWVYINGTKKIPLTVALTSLSDALAFAGTVFGSASGSSSNWSGSMAHIAWGSGVPTDAQMWILARSARQVVFEGDSRSTDKNWPAAAAETAFASGDHVFGGRGVASWAISGQTVATMLANAPTNIDPLLKDGHNVIVIWGGVNDSARTAQAIYDDLIAYCAARKAAGWHKVVLCTEIDAVVAGWTAKYQALNALIAANHGLADQVADLGADSRLQNNADTTYFLGDGVHLTAAGYAVVAEIVAPVLAAVG